MAEYAEHKGLKVYMDSRTRGLIDWLRYFSLGVDEVDVIAVVGGDGTILRTMHLLGDLEIPILTIRHGKRGFLADVPPHDFALAIDRLLSGVYSLHEYMRLAVQTERVDNIPYALNDAVVTTSSDSRGKVCRLRVMKYSQGGVPERVLTVVGDGVITSTPVGSTAYSLAAGGPIVDPLMRAIVITPLAPISLCSRPVVLPDHVKVSVEVEGDSHPVELFVDGVLISRLEPGDTILVSKAPKPAKVIRFFTEDYFSKVFERCL
ncbi:MAG: NAD(+)/NADH kinase [Sulfolobales archaeon]